VIDEKLLNILVCPQDRGPLLLVAGERLSGAPETAELLYNPRLRQAYRIDGGIPVLLIDEAIAVGADEHERLLAHADESGSST
jgi:uncharacterized protein YbaR (Trm112 family)